MGAVFRAHPRGRRGDHDRHRGGDGDAGDVDWDCDWRAVREERGLTAVLALAKASMAAQNETGIFRAGWRQRARQGIAALAKLAADLPAIPALQARLPR